MNLTPSTAKRKLLDIFKFPCLGAMISLHVINFCSPVSTGANAKKSLLKARLIESKFRFRVDLESSGAIHVWTH